jgi:hypothetical protein
MDQVSRPLPLHQAPLTNFSRNVFEAIKFLGVIRFAATYPTVGLLLKFLQTVMPSFSAKRAAHLEFTGTKIEKRLDQKTDRKDFISYASFCPSAI